MTASDSDGDTSTGTIDVTLVPTTPGGMEAPATKSTAAVMDQQLAANNNTVLLGAIAGAGLMSASAAAAESDFHVSAPRVDADFSQSSLMSSVSALSVDNSSISMISDTPFTVQGGEFGVSRMAFRQEGPTSDGLTRSSASPEASAQADLPQGSDVPAASQAADVAAFATGDVAMPSLEALMASVGQQGAHAGETGNVAQVLADALAGGGGADIDALLANLPGNGGNAADGLASHNLAAVSAWDMGAFGGFSAVQHAFTMETLVLHQDAVVHQA